MAVWEFNRGEWTEAYVFMRLLGDGRIYGADANLQKNLDVFIDIESVLRFEATGLLKFVRTMDGASVRAYENDVQFVVVTTPEISDKAAFLYNSIKAVTAGDRKLSVPTIQAYLEGLRFSSPKAPPIPNTYKDRYGEKSDIILTSRDSSDRAQNTEGFSIKSYLGSNPTLFNAAEGSRLFYKVVGCTEAKMHEINSKGEFLHIVKAIKDDSDLSLEFLPEKSNENFSINLEKVDSRMLDVIDATLRIQCGLLDNASSSSIADLVEKLSTLNPLRNRDPKHFYSAKFKDFLFASFAGLTASRRWDARRKVTGGYIEVDGNGDMLYYRAMSDDVFSSYLFNNTKIDRPDRGPLCELACAQGAAYCEGRELTEDEIKRILYKPSNRTDADGNPAEPVKRPKKCNFGYVFKEGDEYFFTLNFQIRFK